MKSKLKGKRQSHNVELADTFGEKSKYKFNDQSLDYAKLPALVEADMKKMAGAAPTKQQKINEAANRLNNLGQRGKIPTPSPRGQAPVKPKGKAQKKTTEYPGTHTSNKTTKKLVSSVEKYGRGALKRSIGKK